MRKGTTRDILSIPCFWYELIALRVLSSMVQVSRKNTMHGPSYDSFFTPGSPVSMKKFSRNEHFFFYFLFYHIYPYMSVYVRFMYVTSRYNN